MKAHEIETPGVYVVDSGNVYVWPIDGVTDEASWTTEGRSDRSIAPLVLKPGAVVTVLFRETIKGIQDTVTRFDRPFYRALCHDGRSISICASFLDRQLF